MMFLSLRKLAILSVFVLIQVIPIVSDTACEATSLQDVLDASRHATFVYGTDIKKGDNVTGATHYTIQGVYEEHFTWLRTDGVNGYFEQPVKAIVTKKSTPPTTMIVFMGSSGALQIFNQLVYDRNVDVTISRKKISILAYFWKTFELLGIHHAIRLHPEMRYIVVGHSLGGALASLYGLVMAGEQKGALWKNKGSRLITFGATRVGGQEYANHHDEMIPPYKKLRIVNDNDPIPHLFLPMRLGYRHESREIWIKETKEYEYFQKKCWVSWWPKPCYSWRHLNDWRICSLGEAPECSNSEVYNSIPSISDHLILNYIKMVELLVMDIHKSQQMKFLMDQCLMP